MTTNKFTINYTSVLLGLLGIAVGFGVGMNVSRLQKNLQATPLPAMTENLNGTEKLFSTTTGIINGKITKIDNNTLTVETAKGSATLSLNQPVYISDQSGGKPSTDIKKVPLNEFSVLTVQKTEDQYKVMSITILPIFASPPSVVNTTTDK